MIWYIQFHCLKFTSISSKLNLIVPVLTCCHTKKNNTKQNKTKQKLCICCTVYALLILPCLTSLQTKCVRSPASGRDKEEILQHLP